MSLNWTPEVYIDLILCAGFIIVGGILTRTYLKQKNNPILMIAMVWYLMGIFFLLEALSFLLLDTFIGRIYAMLFVPMALCIKLAVNYTKKESYLSIDLIIISILGAFLIYFGLDPSSAEIILEAGHYTVIWTGAFDLLGILFMFIVSLYFFAWALETWIRSPFELKQESLVFLIGCIFFSPVSLAVYLLIFIEPIFILFADMFVMLGVGIITYSLVKDTRIWYVLPFIIYKIEIQDNKGEILFSYHWKSGSITEETMISKSITSLAASSEGFISLVDLNTTKLVIFSCESFKIGLYCSKFSKMLQSTIKTFAKEFKPLFNKSLTEGVSISQFQVLLEDLVWKYFSHFPSRIVESEKMQLLFPLEENPDLEHDLAKIFTDKKELEYIKDEINKAPQSSVISFLELYQELKESEDID